MILARSCNSISHPDLATCRSVPSHSAPWLRQSWRSQSLLSSARLFLSLRAPPLRLSISSSLQNGTCVKLSSSICCLQVSQQSISDKALWSTDQNSDWINSLNNTISGFVLVSSRDEQLHAGPACTANGYIGQLSVQAVDFNILVISAIVLSTVYKQRLMAEPSKKELCLICGLPWVMPIISSTESRACQRKIAR